MYKRGVKKLEKTEKQENQILYDWVTISSRIDSPQSIIRFLGLNREEVVFQLASGHNFYKQKLTFGGVSVLFDGIRDDMGVCLEMSGTGCRTFESFGTGDYESLWQYVQDNPDDLNITRLDVAFDDHEGVLDMDQLKLDTVREEYISKWVGGTVHHGHGNKKDEDTVEFGSKNSLIFLRIYNKAAERGFHDRHWIRAELQMRDARAVGFLP